MSTLKKIIYLSSGLVAVAAGYWLFSGSNESALKTTAVEKQETVSIPEVDRVKEFFNLAPPKLPFVETVTYTSRPVWQVGKSAWLSDYASHYKTSRHFIARSLNQKPDYQKQNVKEGDRFNVLREDVNFSFHLVLDLSALKLLFYTIDHDTNQPTLIKTYVVSVGRPDPDSSSGFLTPMGTYSLGDKVAIYDQKKVGFYQGEKTELIRIFGTRWVPFEKEIKDCTASGKGLGIHGMPWIQDPFTKDFREDISSLGCYSSDGCVRMKTEDMEELFAIIVSRPTQIEIVNRFEAASVYQNKGKG